MTAMAEVTYMACRRIVEEQGSWVMLIIDKGTPIFLFPLIRFVISCALHKLFPMNQPQCQRHYALSELPRSGSMSPAPTPPLRSWRYGRLHIGCRSFKAMGQRLHGWAAFHGGGGDSMIVAC